MLFTLVTTAACASLVAVVLAVQTGQQLHGLAQRVQLALAMVSLAGAWLLIQTNFALRYARAYYRPPADSQEPPRRLAFPGDKEPDYLDFLGGGRHDFAGVRRGRTHAPAGAGVLTLAIR